jgi:hypothetical protein
MNENTVSTTSNEIITVKNSAPDMSVTSKPAAPKSVTNESVYGEQLGQMIGEAVAAMKADRINTNRAVSAEIASNVRVQNQSNRYIAVCEQELRRKDLSEERRTELIKEIREAKTDSAESAAESRAFMQEQLDYSHKRPWKIIGTVLLITVGVGGVALLRAA